MTPDMSGSCAPHPWENEPVNPVRYRLSRSGSVGLLYWGLTLSQTSPGFYVSAVQVF